MDLPDAIDLDGATLIRVESPDGIACWTAGIEGGDGGWTVSIIAEPAEEPSAEARDAAQGIVAGFGALSEAAIGYLVDELPASRGDLSEADRALLAAQDPPFGAPEAVVWPDGTWMMRFAECGLEIGDDYGVGVMFAGSRPVAVEDLSDPDDVE
ncbi:hypothetical protein [Microbacterium panaciterrae]|uniref:DUF2262 domain-containing protein n=1 Tax=Microbacterium panaciterrae TaxID=985759 RepID=A0ABP8P321_9MICO